MSVQHSAEIRHPVETQRPVVGILYCGDLGSTVARALKRSGVRVVTTCAGRTGRTRERALACGAEILPSLDDVARQSDVVVSLVLPSSAADTARSYAERSERRPDGSIFVEANSTGLDVVSQIAQMLAVRDILMVD